jgi:hypothetical protein
MFNSRSKQEEKKDIGISKGNHSIIQTCSLVMSRKYAQIYFRGTSYLYLFINLSLPTHKMTRVHSSCTQE